MAIVWRIDYYISPSGNNPVYEFIESLSINAQSKVGRSLDLLRDYGTALHAPHVKKVQGTPLWELRIIGGDSIRIFYVARVERVFLLLHGFVKRKQKTLGKELHIALARLRETSKGI
jgi:phage-related protein